MAEATTKPATVAPLPRPKLPATRPSAIEGFFDDLFAWRAGKGLRLVPTRANSQPAFGYYLEDPRAPIAHAGGVQVLTLEGDRICAITRFEASVLPWFGLPRSLPSR